MVIKAFEDKVLLPNKRDVLKVHLYFKLLQFGIRPLENDMEIIIELYLFGGYNSPKEQYKFIEHCLEKKLKKSNQSLRNTLSQYVNIGVFDKSKNSSLHLNSKFIPQVDCDKLVLNHIISHAE